MGFFGGVRINSLDILNIFILIFLFLHADLSSILQTQLNGKDSAVVRHNVPMSDYQDSTVRVIWAYHHEDPGESGPKYHDSNRGTRSLRLLNPEKVNGLSTASPYFDLVNQDVSFFFLSFFFYLFCF